MPTPSRVRTTIPARDGVNTDTEPRFSWVMLGIAFILFLATSSYWLGNANSAASLVNAILNKQSVEITLYQRFLLHLAVTLIGMLVIYQSRLHDWTAWQISTSEIMISRLYKDAATTRRFIRGLRIVFGLAICLFLYLAMRNGINDDLPPRTECAAALFFSLLLMLTWNIRHMQPEMVSNTTFTDTLQKTKWISLDPSQVLAAYVMDPHINENIWALSKENRINVSYRQGYVLNRASLVHEISEAVLSENLMGSVRYYFRIAPDFNRLPPTLNTQQIKALNTDFMTQDNLKTFLFLAIGKDKVKSLDELWVEISQLLGNVWSNTGNTHKNITVHLQNQLEDLTKKIARFASIAAECADIVKHKVCYTFSEVDMFTIVFELKDISDFKAKYDDLKKTIDQRARQIAIKEDTIEVEKIKTGNQVILDPTLSTKRLEDLEQLHSNKLGNNGNRQEQQALPPPSVELKIASEKVSNVMKNIRQLAQNSEGGLDSETMLKLISNSTNYFSTRRIEPDDFMRLIKVKLDEEKEERSDEAYRQLIEDTLNELLSKSK